MTLLLPLGGSGFVVGTISNSFGFIVLSFFFSTEKVNIRLELEVNKLAVSNNSMLILFIELCSVE